MPLTLQNPAMPVHLVAPLAAAFACVETKAATPREMALYMHLVALIEARVAVDVAQLESWCAVLGSNVSIPRVLGSLQIATAPAAASYKTGSGRRSMLKCVAGWALAMDAASASDVMRTREWDAFMSLEPECTLDAAALVETPFAQVQARRMLVHPPFAAIGDSLAARGFTDAYGTLAATRDAAAETLLARARRDAPVDDAAATAAAAAAEAAVNAASRRGVLVAAGLVDPVTAHTRPACVWTLMSPWAVDLCETDLAAREAFEARRVRATAVAAAAPAGAARRSEAISTAAAALTAARATSDSEEDVPGVQLIRNDNGDDDDDDDFEPFQRRRPTRSAARAAAAAIASMTPVTFISHFERLVTADQMRAVVDSIRMHQ
nr:hypothetical protein HK105_005394 [Polyrhizophydium stewartii]